MSFGTIRSALRLYKPRIVPKSRIARYGLATVVAAGAGVAYVWRRMEQSLWSDEFKPDPPLPPQYEYKYRWGAQLVELEMMSDAWDTLAGLWRDALIDGADAAVLAAIAAKLLDADAAAPADKLQNVAVLTLFKLLRAGWDDSVHPRERERAIALATVASIVDEDTVNPPFVQWAWAQAWHLAVQDALKDILPVTQLLDLGPGHDIFPILPLALVIAEHFEQRRRNQGLNPIQQCMLASVYTSLAFGIMSQHDPAQNDVVQRYHRRALAVLDPATDPEGTAWGLYLSAIGRIYFHLGLQYEVMGLMGDALETYVHAHGAMPDDDPLKELVHTSVLRTMLRMRRAAAGSSDSESKKT